PVLQHFLQRSAAIGITLRRVGAPQLARCIARFIEIHQQRLGDAVGATRAAAAATTATTTSSSATATGQQPVAVLEAGGVRQRYGMLVNLRCFTCERSFERQDVLRPRGWGSRVGALPILPRLIAGIRIGVRAATGACAATATRAASATVAVSADGFHPQ